MMNDNTHIVEPFDPSKIDVDIANVNLGSLLEQLENNEIELAPDFQRASDIWSTTQKSRLIESILLGLPLPSFYFCEDSNSDRLIIIDGLQRLCALRDFVIEKNNPLKLVNLQFLKDYNGLHYDDLSRPDIRRFKALKITINTLRRATPEKVKYILFQRVNTAGVPLMQQEMRHALNQGQAAVFIKDLAQEESFKRATCYTIRTKRMEDRDFANRFVAFYLGLEGYTGDLDGFMNDRMGALNHMTQEELSDIRNAFVNSMTYCYKIFFEDTFRRRKSIYDRRRPISKAVYDSLSVNVAWLSDEERKILVKKASIVKAAMIELFNNDKFDNAISTGTATKYAVTTRFEMMGNVLNKIISDDSEINNQ